MKRIYPICSPMETDDYSPVEDIFDGMLPAWLGEEMDRILNYEQSRKDKVSLRDLTYKKEIFFDEERGWISISEISTK